MGNIDTSDRDRAGEFAEIEALRQELTKLKHEKAAFQAQQVLLENLVTSASGSSGVEVLRSALQKAIDLCTDLTESEKGSLFILNPSGKIADAILSRTEVTPEQRAKLIGSVLDKGLAGWVSRHRQIAAIADTESDDRWLTLPDQPYTVRSALAVPILRGEELLGILTLLHSQPNYFSSNTADLMQVTADQIALVLENARLYAKLDNYSKALNQELQKGRQIQIDFLPNEIPKLPNWEIATCFHPAKEVAGDFYDAFELPSGDVGLVIADVCDKGVGAALFMALFRSLIRIYAEQTKLRGTASTILRSHQPTKSGWLGDSVGTNLTHLNTLQALELTNNYVAENHWQMSMFATVFFAVLDSRNGLLSYINGGHEPVFIVGECGVKSTLESTGPAVGIMPNASFQIEQTTLEPGDILIGYTDGVTEAKAPDGKLFTAGRLEALLEQSAGSASELIERISTSLFTYIGDAPQFDDITMLAVYRKQIADEKKQT